MLAVFVHALSSVTAERSEVRQPPPRLAGLLPLIRPHEGVPEAVRRSTTTLGLAGAEAIRRRRREIGGHGIVCALARRVCQIGCRAPFNGRTGNQPDPVVPKTAANMRVTGKLPLRWLVGCTCHLARLATDLDTEHGGNRCEQAGRGERGRTAERRRPAAMRPNALG